MKNTAPLFSPIARSFVSPRRIHANLMESICVSPNPMVYYHCPLKIALNCAILHFWIMTNPYPEVAHPTISKQNLHIKCFLIPGYQKYISRIMKNISPTSPNIPQSPIPNIPINPSVP